MAEYRRIKELRGQVLAVLRDMPHTRNSDTDLMVEIWRRFYPDYLLRSQRDGMQYVSVEKLGWLPSQDDVKRLRAAIQNEDKQYLPTVEKVAKARKMNIPEWRVSLGYSGEEGTGSLGFTPPSETILAEHDTIRKGKAAKLYVVGSKSRPGLEHSVACEESPISGRLVPTFCTCEGYAYRGTCRHTVIVSSRLNPSAQQ